MIASASSFAVATTPPSAPEASLHRFPARPQTPADIAIDIMPMAENTAGKKIIQVFL